MNLTQLIQSLTDHPDAGLAFVLPGGQAVPAHFHVTEVGRVRKRFIDCGGTVRDNESCVLQVWVAAGDEDHRLAAGKLAKIIGLASPILAGDDLPVEVEYDVGVITQFAVEGIEAEDNRISFQLAGKHTACLAQDRCGVGGGSAGSACCSPDPAVSLGLSPGVSPGKCC